MSDFKAIQMHYKTTENSTNQNQVYQRVYIRQIYLKVAIHYMSFALTLFST